MRGVDATPTIRALLLAAATTAGASAQPADAADPVAVAERAMDAERVSWGAPEATAAQRLASAGRLLEIRRNLMRDLPDDARRAVWLCDRAQDVLTRVLPVEWAGLTSLFGVQSPEQEQRSPTR